jgi:hypothetical protein
MNLIFNLYYNIIGCTRSPPQTIILKRRGTKRVNGKDDIMAPRPLKRKHNKKKEEKKVNEKKFQISLKKN